MLHLRLNSVCKANNESAAAPAPKDQGHCSAPGSPASPACPSKGLIYFFFSPFFSSFGGRGDASPRQPGGQRVCRCGVCWVPGCFRRGKQNISSSAHPRFIIFSSPFRRLLFPVGSAESRASAGGRCCAGKPLCSSRLNYFQKAAGSEGKEGRENVQEAARQGWVCKGGRCLGDVGSRGRAVPCKKSSHLWEGWKAATLEGPQSTRWVTGQQAHSVGSL